MCLVVDRKKTKKALREIKKAGQDVEFWKVFSIVDGNRLAPLFQAQSRYSDELSDDGGILTAVDPFGGGGPPDGDEGVWGGAYHAYAEERRAKDTLRFMDPVRKCAIRKVSVRPGDILAYGRDGDVAFGSMRIDMKRGDRL